MGVVLSVAIPADGVIGVYSSEKNDSHNILGAEQIMSCNCNDGMNFRHIYSTELVKLERQLRSFPPRIRRELTWWFITKHMHGYQPFMFNKAKFVTENFPIELYGETYCSNAILRAHHDYWELSYNPMKQGCPCHGI
jgi:hypothetical protein